MQQKELKNLPTFIDTVVNTPIFFPLPEGRQLAINYSGISVLKEEKLLVHCLHTIFVTYAKIEYQNIFTPSFDISII